MWELRIKTSPESVYHPASPAGSYVPLSEGGEMYGRGGGGGGGGGPALTGALSSAALSKSSSADYSTYQQYPPAYQQDQVHAQQYLTQHAE